MAADNEEIRRAEKGRHVAMRYGAGETDASAEGRRSIEATAHRVDHLAGAAHHRQRRIGKRGERPVERVDDRERILVRVEPPDPEQRGRPRDAACLAGSRAVDRLHARARLHHLIRPLSCPDETGGAPARHVLVGGEQERVGRAARRTPDQPHRGCASHRPRVGMVLHDDGGGTRKDAAQPPGPRSEREAVHVREVRLKRRDRARHTAVDEHVVDAVAHEVRAPVKPLDHGASSGAGGCNRFAPPGQRRVAEKERVRVAHVRVERVVDLDDRGSWLTSFHLKGRPMPIYCARRITAIFFPGVPR